MTRATLLVVIAAALALAGCGGGGGDGGAPQTGGGTTTKLITAAAGGVVNAPNPGGGEISLNIPPGALAADTTIQLTPLTLGTLPAALSSGYVLFAAATFGPAGTNFSSPVTITFPLPSAKPVGAQLVVLTLNPSGTGWSNFGLATVQAGGLTASVTVNHFSTYALVGSYQVSGTATNGPGMGFIFSAGTMFDGAPVDFYFVSSGPSIQPNHSPAKTTTADYASITRATAGGYDLQNAIPIQAGTVLLFKGQMPGDSHYYKMKVLNIQGDVLTFVYEPISAPLTIAGEWSLGSAGTMSIMDSVAGTGYIIDIHDAQGNLTMTADGQLTGNTLAGNWQYADTRPGGAFSLTFNANFDQFTGTYSGAESGTWNGTKVP
ncbi:MAG: hypothetical protein ACP5R5_09865 [Armatimonadota bacterium]